MKKMICIVGAIILVGILVVTSILLIKHSLNKQEKDNKLIYDEKILDDIYVDNCGLQIMSRGIFIEDIIEKYKPTRIDSNDYYYSIKGNRELKIVTYDGIVKSMYFDNLNKVSKSKYDMIMEGINLQALKMLIGHIHMFYNEPAVLDPKKNKLPNPYCEICFDSGEFCKITFDKEGKIIKEVSELNSYVVTD